MSCFPFIVKLYLLEHTKCEGFKPKRSRWTGYEPISRSLLLNVIYNISIFQNRANEMNLFIVWMQFLTQKKKEQKPLSHFIKVNYSIKTIWSAFSKWKHWKRPPFYFFFFKILELIIMIVVAKTFKVVLCWCFGGYPLTFFGNISAAYSKQTSEDSAWWKRPCHVQFGLACLFAQKHHEQSTPLIPEEINDLINSQRVD